jgi:hypothetical protein
MIDTVIFSRNRPLQLYALLESLHFYSDIKDHSSISVIFKYDDLYVDGLEEIRKKFPHVRFVNQGNFKQDIMSCFSEASRFCTFFVDDIIFKKRCSILTMCGILDANPRILTFSMRMGMHLNYCYPTGENQPIPDGMVQGGFFAWDWRSGSGDWSYPISVDGHVFRKDQMLSWIQMIEFNNPNQFEDRLQIAKQMSQNFGCVCMTSSCIVNLPINRVQDEYKNKSGEELPENLKKIWDQGKKIDFLSLSEINNTSAHYPSSISLLERS